MVVKLGGEAWNVPFAMVVSSTTLISVRDGTQLGVSLRVMVVATPQGTRHYKNRSFSPVLRPIGLATLQRLFLHLVVEFATGVSHFRGVEPRGDVFGELFIV
jgi:hypothetical protein